MKPTVVADEMFPEGAGPYMDLEEDMKDEDLLLSMCEKFEDCSEQDECKVISLARVFVQTNEGLKVITNMRRLQTNERHYEHSYRIAGGSSGLLMDLAANEKAVHADFFNDFDDLYDDEDLL